jgi:hypothetical protein
MIKGDNAVKELGRFGVYVGIFFAATDLTVPPQTNRMRYHKTVFCSQLETKKASSQKAPGQNVFIFFAATVNR